MKTPKKNIIVLQSILFMILSVLRYSPVKSKKKIAPIKTTRKKGNPTNPATMNPKTSPMNKIKNL